MMITSVLAKAAEERQRKGTEDRTGRCCRQTVRVKEGKAAFFFQ